MKNISQKIWHQRSPVFRLVLLSIALVLFVMGFMTAIADQPQTSLDQVFRIVSAIACAFLIVDFGVKALKNIKEYVYTK